VFGRAFRTHVQPVELARKLAKEMDEHRSVSVSRVYVPNEYTVFLSPDDRGQFASYEGSLVGELQEYLGEHARREGYALLTQPRVLIETDGDLAIGEFGIATRVVGGSTEVPPLPDVPSEGSVVPAAAPVTPPLPVSPEPVPAATMVYRPAPVPPEVEEPEPEPPQRETVTLTIGDRLYPVTSRRVVLGRSRECDVRVADGNVSRRHCEIVQESSTAWAVVDLGSTNGTEVNGRRVNRVRLADGDRITVGSTDVVFGRSLS
jgi:hypothetical protein